MNRSIVRSLTGITSRRGVTAAAAIAATALASSADAWTIRVCYNGDRFSVWVTVSYSSTSGNYDPTTNGGLISYNTAGPFDPSDFSFHDLPDGAGGLVSLQGGVDSMMGEFEVEGDMGSEIISANYPNVWIGVGGWDIHYVGDPAALVRADMRLTGFTPEGEGVYLAEGLDIPMTFEITRPDGTTFQETRPIHTLELRSPFSLTPPPCAADCDGNGVLNVDDIDCFVQSFLSGCL